MPSQRLLGALFAGSIAVVSTGCASGPEPVAFQNEVFYARDVGGDQDLSRFEQRYPPLDIKYKNYIGVCVLRGAVCFSRPKDWRIRSASLIPQERFIEYYSTSQYLFAIYERLESTWDPWRVVMKRYEEDVEDSGGKLLSKPVAMASYNVQGRAFDVERRVDAPKEPFMSRTREYLLRSDHRIILVQMVPNAKLEQITPEMLPVVNSLRVY